MTQVIYLRTLSKTSNVEVNSFIFNPVARNLLAFPDNLSHRQLIAEDTKIEAWNAKLQRALDALVKAQRAVEAKKRQLDVEQNPERRVKLDAELEKKWRMESKAYEALEKVNQGRTSLTHIGSGKVSLLKPLIGS